MKGALAECEKDFIRLIVSNGCRMDDRKLLEFRGMTFEFMKEYGTVLVSLGSTRVLATSRCTVTKPLIIKPSQGIIRIRTNISPMAAPYFETGRYGEFFNELRHHLDKSIKESNAVDLESLCITSGEKVWCINLNLTILNHDGNIVGCCNIAALVSLMCCRRNETEVVENEIVLKSFSERLPMTVSFVHKPYCVTFALFKRGAHVVIDPTYAEEQAMDGQITITVTPFSEVAAIHSTGQIDVTKDMLKSFIRIAVKCASELNKCITEAVKAERSSTRSSGICCTYKAQRVVFPLSEICADIPVTASRNQENMEKKTTTEDEPKDWETSDVPFEKASVHISKLSEY